jgi:hypothetical protein
MAASMRRRRLFTSEEDNSSPHQEPNIDWKGPGVYLEENDTLVYVGNDVPQDAPDRSKYRKLYTSPQND